jgi:pyruvate ferredoxin oxidoreductase alpha subunit
VRSYTATSSQGLLYMAEVIFNIAGMRLPLVLTCANRAVSAPINIWNDQQDSVSLRDAGFIQLYAENNQEAVDFHLMGYRLSEDKSVMLPVMVCMDGFILTHGMESVDLPEQEKADKFLPAYKPLYKLDPAQPITMGLLADPDYYMETRFAIQETFKHILELLPKINQEFKSVFNRDYKDCLVEEYYTKDAEKVIVAMGSVCGTIKEVVDELRKKGKKVGLLKIISYRPFPYARIFEALKDVPRVAILDKAVSLGAYAPLAVDTRNAFFGKKKAPKVISSFIAGLGGRDITLESVREIFSKLTAKEINLEFIDLKPELLREEYGE